jgi:cysteine synthase B
MESINGILNQIGNTPLIEATHLISKKGIKLF